MKKMKALGIWLEVTTLVIPGINDDRAELKDGADFVSRELGADTPWHISRFFPHYKMQEAVPTPLETLYQAKQIGIEAGLRYVYVGNVSDAANTVCPGCNRVIVERYGFSVVTNRLDSNGCCSYCGTVIAGVGMKVPAFSG
jgi:pyruvate formate lyase activating enzyme